MGYVSLFYPDAAIAGVDWNAVTAQALSSAEGARDGADLARRLQAVISSVAPRAQVYLEGDPPPAVPEASGPQYHWEYHGYSTTGPQVGKPYDRRLVEGVGSPIDVAVGASIRCRVPGSLPAAAGPGVSSGQCPSGGIPLPDARATRLAAVASAWNVLQHFYPHFDHLPVDWVHVLPGALRDAATASDALPVLQRLGHLLQDGHTWVQNGVKRFVPPFEWACVEGKVVITAVAPDSSVDVRPGDVVVAIDGVAAQDAVSRAEQRVSAATPARLRLMALEFLRCGAPGSTLRMTVERDGQKRSVETARSFDATVKVDDHVILRSWQRRPASFSEVAPGIVYVDMDRATEDGFQAAIPALEKARGLVFDMRGYPNFMLHLPLTHMISAPCRAVFSDVPVVTRPDRQDWGHDQTSWYLSPCAPRFTAPAAFITDEGAVSAAESFMEIVDDQHLGAIVGGNTAGSNGNVDAVFLPGAVLTWTGMKVYKLDGTDIQGNGIHPTVPVSPTVDGIRQGRDELLEAAVAAVEDRVPHPAPSGG
jgi:C-terminal processing protease CtpA/Prc